MKTASFIVFEGLDGTGKSTLAQKLAIALAFPYLKTPSGTFHIARSHFDTESISSEERVAFYLGDCHKLSMQISLGQIPALVLDRYFYSTLAYHKEQAPALVPILLPMVSQLIKPDLVILLHADFVTSLRRIKARSNGASYEDKFLKEEYFQRIYENYKAFIDVPIMEIDSSGSVEETLACILAIPQLKSLIV